MPPQLGPATNGFMQYDVLDDVGTTIGRVVVTGSSPTGISQSPNTTVWSWTDSSKTDFPDKFRLQYDAGGNGNSPGSNQWTFKDGPFDTPGSGPASPNTFGVHKIRRGSASGTLVGHFWNKGTTTRTQYWSGLPAEIDGDDMYEDRTLGLWFENQSPPSIDTSWRWRNDTP
jgi:hypothetical protein